MTFWKNLQDKLNKTGNLIFSKNELYILKQLIINHGECEFGSMLIGWISIPSDVSKINNKIKSKINYETNAIEFIESEFNDEFVLKLHWSDLERFLEQ